MVSVKSSSLIRNRNWMMTPLQSIQREIQFKTLYVLSPHLERPYNAQGRLVHDALSKQLGSIQFSQVIGYFRFRRQTMLALSVGERSLLRELTSAFDHFSCFAVITASLTTPDDLSTQAHDIAFWDINGEKISVHISNMNESTLAYRQFIPSTLGIPSLGSVQVEPSKIIQEYDAAYKHAMDGLNNAAEQVCKQEERIAALKKQIEELERPYPQ